MQTEPKFLLDESLAPAVAQALRLVGYDVVYVPSALSKEGAKDPEIIEWCEKQSAIWIHADDRARKHHKTLLQTSGIRTVWVYRRRGIMSGKEQLRIVSFILPRLIQNFELSPKIRHYRASATNPLSKPGLRRVEI